MAEVVEGEVISSTALTVSPSNTVALAVSVERALAQWDDYQELTRKLLNETDYQSVGNKQFKKKSAWRKYANAFNISDRVSHEEIIRDEDGFPRYARIRVEARHPNGRTAEADHECHLSERCCPAKDGLACPKETWRGHTCCPRGCNGRVHWSHPGDVPATALTRAKNRAIADLIGAGEVSAEEMDGQDQQWVQGQRAAPQRGRQQPSPSGRQAQEETPVRASNGDADGKAVHTSPPAPTGIDQIGPFRKPDSSINMIAFGAELRRQELSPKDLHGIVEPNAAGDGLDIRRWLGENPTRTLTDLVGMGACKRYGHLDPVFSTDPDDVHMECPRCHTRAESEEAPDPEGVQQGLAV